MIGGRTSICFPIEPELPVGFIYKSGFISLEEEQSLVRAIEELEFAGVKMCDAADTAKFEIAWFFAGSEVSPSP